MRAILFSLALALGAGGAAPVLAQQMGQVVSPILTIDREALFEQSEFGQRVSSDLEAESNALAEETRGIEQSLEEEEQRLTEQRAEMAPADFRAAADAFDEKVVQLRTDRERAQAEFVDRFENAQREFYAEIGPVIGRLMQERGAVIVLEKRAVFLSINAIDVTEEAISRIDDFFGAGEDTQVIPDDAPPAPDAE